MNVIISKSYSATTVSVLNVHYGTKPIDEQQKEKCLLLWHSLACNNEKGVREALQSLLNNYKYIIVNDNDLYLDGRGGCNPRKCQGFFCYRKNFNIVEEFLNKNNLYLVGGKLEENNDSILYGHISIGTRKKQEGFTLSYTPCVIQG